MNLLNEENSLLNLLLTRTIANNLGALPLYSHIMVTVSQGFNGDLPRRGSNQIDDFHYVVFARYMQPSMLYLD